MEKIEEHPLEEIKVLLFPEGIVYYKNLDSMVLTPLLFPVSFNMTNSHSPV